jgi:hypothetical protein
MMEKSIQILKAELVHRHWEVGSSTPGFRLRSSHRGVEVLEGHLSGR